MADLLLFSRPDCHLCDEAAELLRNVAPNRSFETVDVEDDIRLLDRYGQRVPVLRLEPEGQELGWPFTAAKLARFLESS